MAGPATAGAQKLIDALLTANGQAAGAAWVKVGLVTAYSSPNITATIDGASVTNIRRISASYATPTNGDVAVFLVVRGTTSVQYVAIGIIT